MIYGPLLLFLFSAPSSLLLVVYTSCLSICRLQSVSLHNSITSVSQKRFNGPCATWSVPVCGCFLVFAAPFSSWLSFLFLQRVSLFFTFSMLTHYAAFLWKCHADVVKPVNNECFLFMLCLFSCFPMLQCSQGQCVNSFLRTQNSLLRQFCF